MVKSFYQKFPVDIILSKKLRMFCLKSGMSQECLLLPLLLDIILEVKINAVRQEREIRGIHIVREEQKLFLFADGIIMYVKS